MKAKSILICTTLLALAMQLPTRAAITTFSDKVNFLTTTGATDETGPLPALGSVGLGPVTVGAVTFSALASPQSLVFTEYSARLPGNELGLSGIESINVSLASPVLAFGFDFVEPQFDPNVNAAFVDSTFTVTLFNGASSVGAFTFNAPNDTAAFVGVSSDAQFTRAEIRETVGGIENEFYGHFYATVVPVPEPGMASLMVVGMVLFGGLRNKRPRC